MEINFEHRLAAHCESGVTSNLLRYYGYDYSEALVFGLSASLYFVHLPFLNIAGYPVTVFRPFPGAIFARVMRLIGISVNKKRFLFKKNGEKQLDRLIEKGIPTGCLTCNYYLPYLPPNWRIHFNAHNVCVIGKEGNNYLISETLLNEKVTISSEDLLRARFAKGSFPPLGKMYWVKSLPQKAPDLNIMVRKAILKNCFRMVRQPGSMPFIGVNGFQYLGNRIPKYPKIYGEKKAALNLVNLLQMIEQIGTGGTAFRFLYADFLKEAAEITGIEELNDFSKQMTDIGDHWRIFANEAGRIYKNRSSINSDYQVVGNILKEIGNREKLFFIELEKVVKQ